jgi:hypothetical protein
MNCTERKLSGLNLWFIIEIMSFYGYIFSAMLFIFIKSMSSTICLYSLVNECDDDHKKPAKNSSFKFDFISFYRKDIDWLAFVFILCSVNIALMVLEETAF